MGNGRIGQISGVRNLEIIFWEWLRDVSFAAVGRQSNNTPDTASGPSSGAVVKLARLE